MSFTQEVKKEITKNIASSIALSKVTLEAMLRLSSTNLDEVITFKTSNTDVAFYFKQSLEKLYNIKPVDSFIPDLLNQSNIYVLTIKNAKFILDDLSLNLSVSPMKDKVLSDDSYAKSYLKGVFLVKGSVSDPKSSNYHLEIIVTNEQEAIFIQRLLNKYNLNAKITKRKKYLVIYFKEIEMIKDFLRIIGTNKNVFYIEETIINKGFEVEIKRIMNMEIANETKSLQAADEQIKNIDYLKTYYPIEKLDNKILLVMQARLKNPNANFNELKDYIHQEFGEEITKSGINHRFRKIKELVQNHKEQRGNQE